MYIDQYCDKWDEYDYNGKGTFMDPCSLINEGIFKFCGCGNPTQNLIYIRDCLAHIHKRQDAPDTREVTTEVHKAWYDKWYVEAEGIFGNKASLQFFQYWATNEDLLEHGGSVGGSWLTAKGKGILGDLIELSEHGDLEE